MCNKPELGDWISWRHVWSYVTKDILVAEEHRT